MTTDISWQTLRSDIYIRDKGICWICNTFVDLTDYDLGHLIDRVNGGHDAYDNLAVMHTTCNHSKPFHNTLEEATKWKLTAFIPTSQQTRTITQQPIITRHRRKVKRIRIPPPDKSIRRQEEYQEQILKIKPNTVCWKQGSPQGYSQGLWRVLPPPYHQEDMFVMNQIPPEAIDNDEYGIKESLQVIGGIEGELLIDTVINLGIAQLHITSASGILSMTFNSSVKSNIGTREQTIGMGAGQIPIQTWKRAKSQGLSLECFKTEYLKNHNLFILPGII
jgi:hypothetical protein